MDKQDNVPLLAEELLEEKYASGSHRKSAKASNWKQLYIIAVVAVVSSLMTIFVIAVSWALLQQNGLISVLTRNKPFVYDEYFNTSSSRVTGCGTSVEEAMALGCRFDELADLWLPQKCSRAFEDEYLVTNQGGPFQYWTKPDGTEVVSNRSQYAGGPTYYSTTRDHLVHCEYNLYRFAESLRTGALVGHSDGFAGHMHHCAEIMGKFANQAPNIDNIDVDTISTFGYC